MTARHALPLLLLWAATTLCAQAPCKVTYYDEEDGLAHSHVTQLLQDEQGFIWLATWNGLCRFDGYEFRTFKSQVGDGCNMATDRFRDIALRPDGKMVCRVDDDYFLFDTRTYRFSNIAAEEAGQAAEDMARYRQSIANRGDDGLISFSFTDKQGNRWKTDGKGLSKETDMVSHAERLDIQPKAEVKCLFRDSRQRYWLTTRDDGAVRVYATTDDRLLGFLGADGRLHAQHTPFGAAIYCIYESADGTLWLGSKPGGLFRLRETAAGTFETDHLTHLPNQNVYSICEDRHGRLWIATLGGGICYTDEPQAKTPRFVTPKGYPKDAGQRVRYLRLTQNGTILMGAATDGLLVAGLESDADRMQFRLHQRESDRAQSLSSSATMDIMEDPGKRIFVSTESGGVNQIVYSSPAELLAGSLSFRHYTAGNHLLPSDVVLSQTPMGRGRTLLVSNHLVTLMDSTGHYRVLDAHFFRPTVPTTAAGGADYRFSDAHPLPLNGGRWLLGLKDGALVTSEQQMYRKAYTPRMVLTGISIQGADDNWTIAYADTVRLQPTERSFTLHFAAIDHEAADRISYAFRLLPNSQWNYIGHNRSATLLNLEPGTYTMEVRSTNSDGEWMDNTRRLVVIVTPTFWESTTGRLLMVVLLLMTVGGIVCTLLYIRHIKRKQRETLEKYLSLIEENSRYEDSSRYEVRGTRCEDSARCEVRGTRCEEDPMLKRVMTFIEENIANSDAGVGDMAAAAATSRSGLQRKLKQTMGITPQDLLREARIKHACLLLRSTDKTVAEVAYACGFTDPKYFSRSFKQSVGQTPSEYKNQA